MTSERISEKQFSEKLFDVFHKLVSADGLSVKVKEDVNILTDVTCVYRKKRFELVHGFSNTDLAFYQDHQYDIPKNNLITFYGDKEIHLGLLKVPYVILELKTGDLTTDAIRSRDFVAGRIKSIFPHVAYFFIAQNTTKEHLTLVRQGKSFTNYFISKDEMSGKDIEEIYASFIKPHIQNLEHKFSVL